MDVSPKTLREVEFREKMRGYHPEDVDQFLEEVAQGLEVLQDRLRQAVDRAQRAETAAAQSNAEGGPTDDTLRRTLVLAQRTADLAVQEAREQAARIVANAEQQGQAILAEAEERARRAHEDTLRESRTELARLEGVRQQGQSEVDMLRRWVDEHRARFISSMRESLGHLERTAVSAPPPASKPLDIHSPRRPSVTGATLPPPAGLGAELTPSFGGPPPAVEVEAHPSGPDTVLLHEREEPEEPVNGAALEPGTGEARFAVAKPAGPPARPSNEAGTGLDATGPVPVVGAGGPPSPVATEEPPGEEVRATGPNPQFNDVADEDALDNFFDDPQYAEERRFGSRLRRRR